MGNTDAWVIETKHETALFYISTSKMSNTYLLDRYEVIKQLGTGATGAVYLVYDHHRQCECALKQMRLDIFPDETQPPDPNATVLHEKPMPLNCSQARRLFKREADVLKTLNHPNLPYFIDYHEPEDGRAVYLAMQYIAGRELDALERNEISIQVFYRIAFQIISGLEYCHRRNIFHRDIKPQNILIGADYKAYLVDFGFAKPADASGKSVHASLVAVSAGYTPLEGYNAQILPKPQHDIYSLGAILYFLATGSQPETPLERANSEVELLLPYWNIPLILAETYDVILKAMHIQSFQRYKSVTTLREALLRADPTAGDEYIDVLTQLTAESDRRIHELEADKAQFKQMVTQAESEFDRWQAALNLREDKLETQTAALAQREQGLQQVEADLAARQALLEGQAAKLSEDLKTFEGYAQALAQREQRLQQAEVDLAVRQAMLEGQAAKLSESLKTSEGYTQALVAREERLQQAEAVLAERQVLLEGQAAKLSEDLKTFEGYTQALAQREQGLQQAAAGLVARQASLDSQVAQIAGMEAELKKQKAVFEAEVNQHTLALNQRERELHLQIEAIALREKKILHTESMAKTTMPIVDFAALRNPPTGSLYFEYEAGQHHATFVKTLELGNQYRLQIENGPPTDPAVKTKSTCLKLMLSSANTSSGVSAQRFLITPHHRSSDAMYFCCSPNTSLLMKLDKFKCIFHFKHCVADPTNSKAFDHLIVWVTPMNG